MANAMYVYVCLLLLGAQIISVNTCISGGRTSLRGRPGRISNREPLIYGQYIPNRSELSVSASGTANGRITRDSPRFKDLIENHNVDIVFKDDERTNADRTMSHRCKDKLDSLAIMVMNQWPGVKLRVIEGWDEDDAHASDSLHYEGRAVDITTSDRDRHKLSLLARLAYDAGFDYVSYESKHHIHCSVKSEEEANMFGPALTSGCFAASSHVTMEDGSPKPIGDVKINDRVLTMSSDTGEIIPDTVFMFLDVDSSSKQQFLELSYEEGNITLTDYHLLYAAKDKNFSFIESVPIYAKDISRNNFVYININNRLVLRQILNVQRVVEKGFYAPLTLSGNIIVNEVASSCYASINRHWVAHLALAPLRLFHYLLNTASSSVGSVLDAPQTGVHWYATVLAYIFPYLLS